LPLEGEFAPQEAREWEAKIYRRMCAEAEAAIARLEALELDQSIEAGGKDLRQALHTRGVSSGSQNKIVKRCRNRGKLLQDLPVNRNQWYVQIPCQCHKLTVICRAGARSYQVQHLE
jgi:hypothetical protein